MLTDRDIAIVAVARDFDPQSLRVGDVMSSDLVSARPEDSVADALATMRARGVRRLPITTEQGMLIGILTLDDLLDLLADELNTMVLTMEGGLQHETRARV
jgi:CBS domain-containing protein